MGSHCGGGGLRADEAWSGILGWSLLLFSRLLLVTGRMSRRGWRASSFGLCPESLRWILFVYRCCQTYQPKALVGQLMVELCVFLVRGLYQLEGIGLHYIIKHLHRNSSALVIRSLGLVPSPAHLSDLHLISLTSYRLFSILGV